MVNQQEKQVSISEWISIIRRRKWILISSLIGFLAPVLIYNQTAIPIYRAETKIIFEEIEKMMDFDLFGSFNKGNFITNKIEEMETHFFAEEVLKQLPGDVKRKFQTLSTYSPILTLDNYIIEEIQNGFSVEPVRGTEVLNIFFESEDPALAKVLATTITNVLKKRDLNIRRQQYNSVEEFVEEQFEIVKLRLQNAENALKEYKENKNVTTLEGESKEILERITQAEILFNEVKSTKRETQQRLSAIQDKLDKEKEGFTENVAKTTNPMAVKLKEKLVELEVQYSNLQVQGLPLNNSKMVDLKKEINHTKQNLKIETVKIVEGENLESIIDPFSQIKKFLEESISLEINLQALEAKEQNLQSLLSSYADILSKLPETEMNLVRLMRDKEVNNQIYMKLLEAREESRIKQAAEISAIRILQPARLPDIPVSPKKLLNILLGFFLSVAFGVSLVLTLEYTDNLIRTQDDAESATGFSVLVSIPKLKKELNKLLTFNGKSGQQENSIAASILIDLYNLLYFALLRKGKNSSTMMITSTIPGEGKSTLATMLALTSARRGKRTLLMDGDLKKPKLHTIFQISRKPGLTNLFVQHLKMQKKSKDKIQYDLNRSDSKYADHSKNQPASLKNQMLRTALLEGIMHTFEDNLFVLTCGFAPQNSLNIWSNDIWTDIFNELKGLFDLIIVDAPPILGVVDATIMPMYLDNILFCVESGAVDRRTLQRSLKTLKDAINKPDEKILGIVLNKIDLKNEYGNYKYYYKYYAQKKDSESTDVPDLQRMDSII